MNILLVDDEVIMIDILRQAIDWVNIGITQVFGAYNAQEARKILSENDVDILICDIEMPQESGLDLLRWVRAEYPFVINIILTSFPDFSYAKDAIELEVNKYLLKPVAFDDLRKTLTDAVDKINKQRINEKYIKYGENEISDRQKTMKILIKELILEEIQSTENSIIKEIGRIGLNTNEIKNKTMILFYCKDEKRLKEDGKIIKFAFVNIAEELFQDAITLCLDYSPLFIIDAAVSKIRIEEMVRAYQDAVTKFLKYSLSAYVLMDVKVEQISTYYDLLIEKANYSTEDTGELFYIEKDISRENEVQMIFDRKKWEFMLREMNKNHIIYNLQTELKQASRLNYVDKNYLLLYQQEFLRLYYKITDNDGVLEFNENSEGLRLFETASDSISKMRLWVEKLVDNYINMIKSQRPETGIEHVKKYLEKHYNESINREDIEQMVHLNTDYFNRIFKAATGYSLMEYIQYYRIQRAKELLNKTNKTISDISLEIGYESPAYFSKIFKKIAGITPQEFRNIGK